MSEFKKGQKVLASTVAGAVQYAGKIHEVRHGQKGIWYEIKPDDGTPNFSTRAAKIRPA